MADYETILAGKTGAIGKITLNRPERLDAINVRMGHKLLEALAKFEEDPDVRCLVLTGAGRSFRAGDDLKGMESNGFERP